MQEIRYFRVEELPPVLEPNAVYYVKNGDGFDKFITNSDAVVVTTVPADIRVKQNLGDSVYAVMSQDAVTRELEQVKTQGITGTAEQIKQMYESNPNTNAFTTAEKEKLATVEASKFRGTFISYAELAAGATTPSAGDYADVDGGVGFETVRYIWDATDDIWVYQQSSTSLTSAQVKQMYESNPDTNVLTDDDRVKLNGIMFGATANAPDAQLRSRSTHTGTQDVSTITGLGDAATHNYGTTANTIMAGDDPRVVTSVTQAELTAGLAGKAAATHTHHVSQVSGLGTAATTPITDYAKARGRIVSDPNTVLESGMYGVEGSVSNNITPYTAMIVARNADTGLQISGGYNTDSLKFRGFSGSGAVFTDWRTLFHSGNQITLGNTAALARVALGLGTAATTDAGVYASNTHTHQWDEIGAKPIVQTTGQSTTSIMSQKAVTDAIGNGGGGGTSGIADRNNILFDGTIKTSVEFDHISVSNQYGYAAPASPLNYSSFMYPGGFSCKSPTLGGLYTYYTPVGISVGTSTINTMMITDRNASGMYNVQFKGTVHVDGGLFVGESIGTGSTVWANKLEVKSGTTVMANVATTGVATFVDVNITSDARYKSNKTKIGSPVDKVNGLTGYNYTLHSDIGGDIVGDSVGVLAQDVEKILPACVTNTDGKLSVSYSGITALLVEVVKELNIRIEVLERTIEQMG